MPARPISFYLKNLEGAQPPLAEARRLAELNHAYREVAPRELSRLSAIGSYRDGTMKIYATSGPVAAKLRQIVPRLIQAFRERGYEVTSIQTLVQAPATGPGVQAPTPRSLSPGAAESLEALANRLPASPLQEAVRALLAHGRAERPEK